MNDILLTVFTPTYNRVNNLKELYASLCNQSNKNFIWLIIDDGSFDETKMYIEEIINDKKIKIEYFYQENQGKYIAHNNAVKKCKTEYIVCVDSDDILVNNAIEIIYKNIFEDNSLIKKAGYIFPRNKSLAVDIKEDIDVMDIKFKYKNNTETTIVLFNEIAQNNLFPEIENEKFMSEEVIYTYISEKYKFKFINCPVCKSEYLKNGLTSNIYIYWSKNFKSTILFLTMRYKYLKKYKLKIKILNRIKTIMNLNAVCIKNKRNIFKYTPSIFCSIVLMLPSIFWRIIKYE